VRPITRLEAARRNGGLTQRALADRVGITRQYVSLIEGGLRPPVHVQAVIAAVLDASPRELFPLGDGEVLHRSFSAEFSSKAKDERGRPTGFTVLAGALTNRPFLPGLSVALAEDRGAEAFSAEDYLAEAERLVESGDFNPEACAQQVRAARLMVERDLDYPEAAAVAWKEIAQ